MSKTVRRHSSAIHLQWQISRTVSSPMTLIDFQRLSRLFKLFLSENKCSLFFWSLIQSSADLAKKSIADDLE